MIFVTIETIYMNVTSVCGLEIELNYYCIVFSLFIYFFFVVCFYIYTDFIICICIIIINLILQKFVKCISSIDKNVSWMNR